MICDSDDSVSAAQPLVAAVRAAATWTIDVLPVLSTAGGQGALMICRAVILVISRSFLTRSWPSPEITLIHLREHLEHREIMIVLYRGVTQADVASFSPLLAGRTPIFEKDGTEEIVNRLSSILSLEAQPG